MMRSEVMNCLMIKYKKICIGAVVSYQETMWRYSVY